MEIRRCRKDNKENKGRGENMKPLNEIKQGCGKGIEYKKCGNTFNKEKKIYLCPSCQALLTQTEEIIKEIDEMPTYAPVTSEIMEKTKVYGEWINKNELRQRIIGEDLQEKEK